MTIKLVKIYTNKDSIDKTLSPKWNLHFFEKILYICPRTNLLCQFIELFVSKCRRLNFIILQKKTVGHKSGNMFSSEGKNRQGHKAKRGVLGIPGPPPLTAAGRSQRPASSLQPPASSLGQASPQDTARGRERFQLPRSQPWCVWQTSATANTPQSK